MTRGEQVIAAEVEAAEAWKFIDTFFECTVDDIELRAIHTDRSRKNDTRTLLTRGEGTFRDFCAKHGATLNLYFGCATRKGGGKKTNCREVPALWADLDFKDSSEAEARSRLAAFGSPPSIIIHSGGGLHVYWLLKNPAAAEPATENILRGLAEELAGDPACAELAHVLRIPYTLNHKYDPPRAVTVEKLEAELRYPLEDFAKYGSPAPQRPAPQRQSGDTAKKIPVGRRYAYLLSRAGEYLRKGDSLEAGTKKVLLDFGSCEKSPNDNSAGEQETVEMCRKVWAAYSAREKVDANEVATPEELALADMPHSVLDGKLGEICRERMLEDFPVAYAWPALLVAASAVIDPQDDPVIPTNLYVALVGPANSGKSWVRSTAAKLLSAETLYHEVKAGSAEGLVKYLTDKDRKLRLGENVVVSPDELLHLLDKAQIPQASFATNLCSLFYEKKIKFMRVKEANEFDYWVSVIGGLVFEKFSDAFTGATTGGLYDRFIFGLCPSNFACKWRLRDKTPAFNAMELAGGKDSRPALPLIDQEVYTERDRFAEREKFQPSERRLLELGLRAAVICAAFEGRKTLLPEELVHAFEFILYQRRARTLLRPNTGKNTDGIVTQKILDYLDRQPAGKWIRRLDMIRNTHIYDYGAATVDRAIACLTFAGDIEQSKLESASGPKPQVLRRAGNS